ncbi:hypothetical protein [Nonomuraea zeae]|uniref:hypothetical protein n=1 Tax=Nonomuraea zeae TaxID=1642303 RepID=UPI001F0F9A3E|nr:hypothetical protein [Nonomuraea zeae]
MKALVEVFGWLLLVQGAGGAANTLFGWWHWAHGLLVVNHVGALEGYEVFVSLVLGVLGLVLLAVVRSVRSVRSAKNAEDGK